MLSYWDKKPFPGTVDSLYVKWVAYQMGVNLVWVGDGADHKLLGVGDVLKHAKKGDTIWGSYCAGEKPHRNFIQRQIKADLVQGPLTMKCIDSTAIGHPAWLTASLRPRTEPATIKIGIFAAPDEWKLFENILVKRVDVWLSSTLTTNVGAVLDEILRCEKIATSSVTVYAICHSYGIPATLFAVREPTFEMMDYCHNTGVPARIIQITKEDVERRQFKIAGRVGKPFTIKEDQLADVRETCPFKKDQDNAA